jgi:hypothetical protein
MPLASTEEDGALTTYYTLLSLEEGAWHPQFGDYDRENVEFEREDYAYSQKRPMRDFKIIKTSDHQDDIDAEVARLNRYRGATPSVAAPPKGTTPRLCQAVDALIDVMAQIEDWDDAALPDLHKFAMALVDYRDNHAADWIESEKE